MVIDAHINKLVLFDLDGTLVKAGGAGRLALNRAVKELLGKEDICSHFFLAGGTDKDNFRQSYISATGKNPSAGDIQKITETYLKYLPAEVEHAVRNGKYYKIKGVDKLLKTLSAHKDVIVALGTGNLKPGAFIKLKPSGLLGHFVCGGFGCDGYTRLEVLNAAVKRAEAIAKVKIKPSMVYVIGDTHRDVASGKEGGFHTAALTCGFGPAEDIYRACPEFIADDFSDLQTWLVWLGLQKDPKGVERGCYIFPDTPIEHVQFGYTGMDTSQLRLMRKTRCTARAMVKKREKK